MMGWTLPNAVKAVLVETPESKVNATLRDKFAMAALPAVMTNNLPPHLVAKMAYVYADEMLKERSK
jgi:hypothetical protein